MPQRSNQRTDDRIGPFLGAAYDNVNMALWAMLIAGLIVFAVFGIPAMSSAQARYQALQARAVEAENAFYCRRWGMGPGSGKHRLCMSDLNQVRRNVEERLADESDF